MLRNIKHFMINDYIHFDKELLMAKFDNLKYEIKDEINDLKTPICKSCEETVDYILKNKSSICRLGDGEHILMLNESIPFQNYDENLSLRLKEISLSNHDNILICLNGYYWGSLKGVRSEASRDYIRKFMYKYRDRINQYIDFNKIYYNASLTAYHYTFQYDDEKTNIYFNNIREIWNKRDIVLVKGTGIFNHFQNNVFNNVNSVEYIDAPNKNAFSEYKNILKQCLEYSKNKLFLIILGPTATVLAYDLAILGYQALDMGHIAKDYDYFKCGFDGSVVVNGKGFCDPD